MTTVIARCVGAGDYEQVKYYTKKLLGITYACMVVTNVIIVLVLPLILKAYNLSSQTAEVTTGIVIFYAVCCVLIWPLAFTIPATFRASGDAKMCMFISVFVHVDLPHHFQLHTWTIYGYGCVRRVGGHDHRLDRAEHLLHRPVFQREVETSGGSLKMSGFLLPTEPCYFIIELFH